MKYYDEKMGRFRQTLDCYLLLGETHESIIHKGCCVHRWRRCLHNGVDSLGDQAVCVEVSFYLTYSHYVCGICGEEKYPERWGDIATKILETRRTAAEALEVLETGQTK